MTRQFHKLLISGNPILQYSREMPQDRPMTNDKSQILGAVGAYRVLL